MNVVGADSLKIVEPVSIGILIVFFALMVKRSGDMKKTLTPIIQIAVASWIAEVSCIRIYGFYQYDAPWTFFVDVMPLLVALIWPFVILSAMDLIEAFGITSPLAVFGVVLYDASLVEPVAVVARLWSWNEPGVFGVPIIGILGWAYFSFVCVILLKHLDGAARWAIVLAAPALTHVMLLATWWLGLRWIFRGELPPWGLAGASWGAAVLLGAYVVRAKLWAPIEVMAPRMAAALLFFGLLALRGSDLPPLIAYCAAFSVPYLLATRLRSYRAMAPAKVDGRAAESHQAPG